MPQIKNAQIRFRVINKSIRNKYDPFPSKKKLRDLCEESLFGSEDGDNICESTIEKDIYNMRMDFDAPIKYSKRENGYYYEDENFSIDEIPLTDDDLNAISFATKTLMHFRNTGLFQQFSSTLDKISDRVNVSANDNNDDFIQFEKSIGGSEESSDLSTFLTAVKNNNIVQFDYASFVSGVSKLRTVLPLLLKEYKNRWYLISFDKVKEQYVTYALDRIKNLVVTDEVMSRPDSFKADNYFEYAVGITSNNAEPVRVVFNANQIASKYIDSLKFHKSQKTIKKLDDNWIQFSLQVSVSEELIRELLTYSGDIEVLEPVSLKEELKIRALKIIDRYK